MVNKYKSDHWMDEEENPAGGYSTGIGFSIKWHDGPLRQGTSKIEPNRASVKTIIEVAKDRLLFYQKSKFKCTENVTAINMLESALDALNQRIKDHEKET